MWDFDTHNELYIIKCICWLMYIDYSCAFMFEPMYTRYFAPSRPAIVCPITSSHLTESHQLQHQPQLLPMTVTRSLLICLNDLHLMVERITFQPQMMKQKPGLIGT